MFQHAVALCTFIAIVSAQIFDCPPPEWVENTGTCYKFVSFPRQSYAEAASACQTDGASLLSVNTLTENNFVTSWLRRNDNNNNRWFTSGVQDAQTLNGTNQYRWEGDGTIIKFEQQYWTSEADQQLPGNRIVYARTDNVYGWTKDSATTVLSYICEISKAETYRIIEQERGFDYGVNYQNLNDIKKGPQFTIKPHDIIVVGKSRSLAIECATNGNPQPTYEWQRGGRIVTSQTNTRYTLSNGRLFITDPFENEDAGSYRCSATNEFGTIVSAPIQLSFGFLGEFSNVQDGALVFPAHQGNVIQCKPPTFKPQITVRWKKINQVTGASQFIHPELESNLFISNSGGLYISEVSATDQGYYICDVGLLGRSIYDIGTAQPPMRSSVPRFVRVTQAAANNFGPDIHNDFISVFPSTPMRGDTIRMECFAFGQVPITYAWERVDGLMPETASYPDPYFRVLLIADAKLQDSGTYRCIAKRTSTARDTRDIALNIQAVPYFIYNLTSQHLDLGKQLTWRCEAKGLPLPRYTWLKNGVVLRSVLGDIEVNRNVLTISSVGEKHEGMYQCEATNTYGITMSTGQLRVLSFRPNFIKHPLNPRQSGTINGQTTIICKPEGAPYPFIEWLKDNRNLNLAPDDTASRVRMLPNGNLLLTNLQLADAGRYTCKATNEHGTNASTCQLTISKATTIARAPSDTKVNVNETAFFYCEASYNQYYDMVYVWKFNNRIINMKLADHLEMQITGPNKGLYIRQAEFDHAGRYECIVETILDAVNRTADLMVLGPPGEPAGVYGDVQTATSHSIRLHWTAGTDHGSPIQYYIVEAQHQYTTEWEAVAANIIDRLTIEPNTNKRFAVVDGLKPGNLYIFRLRAVNKFGIGLASLPSASYPTPPAPPTKPPDNVGGGGGKVGTLNISWTPLPQQDQNGDGVGYNVYWRQKGQSDLDWIKNVIYQNIGELVLTVGLDYFYLEYEVKVQAKNIKGLGPNSTIQIVMSAEDLPLAVPEDISPDSYNSTAIIVMWTPVINSREFMKGAILGYRINYWMRNTPEDRGLYLPVKGDVDTAIIIGLEADSEYWITIQSENSAGVGHKSERQLGETAQPAPHLYPTELAVHSMEQDPNLDTGSVYVTWRGISTDGVEEPLQGYKVRWWKTTEDYRTFRELSTGKENYAVISEIEFGDIYKLRILGYSLGGFGNLCPTIYFTFAGMAAYDPTTSQILAFANNIQPSLLLVIIISVVSLFLNRL